MYLARFANSEEISLQIKQLNNFYAACDYKIVLRESYLLLTKLKTNGKNIYKNIVNTVKIDPFIPVLLPTEVIVDESLTQDLHFDDEQNDPVNDDEQNDN